MGIRKKIVFFRILMKSYDIFQPSFFIGKTDMFEHRKLTKEIFCHVLLDFEKRLKIDHFERGMSDTFE